MRCGTTRTLAPVVGLMRATGGATGATGDGWLPRAADGEIRALRIGPGRDEGVAQPGSVVLELLLPVVGAIGVVYTVVVATTVSVGSAEPGVVLLTTRPLSF